MEPIIDEDELDQIWDSVHRQIYGDETEFEEELTEITRNNDEIRIPKTEEEELAFILDASEDGSNVQGSVTNPTKEASNRDSPKSTHTDTHPQMGPQSSSLASERIRLLNRDDKIRLYELRMKKFGRAIWEAAQADDRELAKLLLCGKKKIEEAIRLLREGGSVKPIPRPPILNPEFPKPVLSTFDPNVPLLARTELNNAKSREEKRAILVQIVNTQQTELEELLCHQRCFNRKELKTELEEFARANNSMLVELNEDRFKGNPLEPRFWNVTLPRLNKNLSVGADQLQVMITWLKNESNLNTVLSITLNYPPNEPQQKSVPEEINTGECLRIQEIVLFHLFRNASPVTISQLELSVSVRKSHWKTADQNPPVYETHLPLKELDRHATLHFTVDTKGYGLLEIVVRRCRPTNGSNFVLCTRPWMTLVRRRTVSYPSPQSSTGKSTQSQPAGDTSKGPNIEDSSRKSAGPSSQTPSHFETCSSMRSNCITPNHERLYSYHLLQKQADRYHMLIKDSGATEEDRQRNLQTLRLIDQQLRMHEKRISGPDGGKQQKSYLEELCQLKRQLMDARTAARSDLSQRTAIDYQLNVIVKELQSLGVISP